MFNARRKSEGVSAPEVQIYCDVCGAGFVVSRYPAMTPIHNNKGTLCRGSSVEIRDPEKPGT